MFTRSGVSKVGIIIAGLALGWSTGANAQASARATAQSRAAAAQQQADAARQRATELARAGGWAYKTGLVERAQRDAARPSHASAKTAGPRPLAAHGKPARAKPLAPRRPTIIGGDEHWRAPTAGPAAPA